MELRHQYVASVMFVALTMNNVYAQNREQFKSFMKDERKRELLNDFKPSLSPQKLPQMIKPDKGEGISDKDVARYYHKYKTGMFPEELTDIPDTLNVNKNILNFSVDAVKPAGYTEPVYMGGKFVLANPVSNGNAGGNGMNLSGWKPKKLSKRAQLILKNVLGMEVDPRDCE